MKLYLNHTQVPEMKSLPNDEIREKIHAIAKSDFDNEHANIGIRGLLIVAVSMAGVCAAGNAFLGDALDSSALLGGIPIPLLFLGGMGAWIGALLHGHFVLCEMRPYYRKMIERL